MSGEEAILQAVRDGTMSVETAAEKLREPSFADIGFARVDLRRRARQGFPEVIFCAGKTPEQAAEVAKTLAHNGQNVLATRAAPAHYAAIRSVLPQSVFDESARVVTCTLSRPKRLGNVAVCSAGTADIPVAGEAAATAEAFGCAVTRVYDVGVAGIHRLFDRLPAIRAADVVIAVAGMEGALTSVIGGLVERPVIAVPTSIGYGANFHGLSALLTMLNSCAAGVGVVNIDNGFGAGCLAAQILRLAATKAQEETAAFRREKTK